MSSTYFPIPVEAAVHHVQQWSQGRGEHSWWAEYLFFAADALNAAEIIRAGRLLCRQNLGVIERDIANQGAIAVNPEAHRFVRLYFRPKTPFHLRTEGIKLLSDPNRLQHQMSMPVMFVFRLPSVITMEGVCFSNRKMAHAGMVPGSDLDYFNRIEFDKVYHEAPILDPAARRDIHDCRMAEVLVPGELSILPHIEVIICRTQLDAWSLEHLVGRNHPLIQYVRIAVPPARTFYCWENYIEEAEVTNGVIAFKLKPSRYYSRNAPVKFRIQRMQDGRVSQEWTAERPLTGNTIRVSGFRCHPGGNWRIEVEDALAFIGELAERRESVFRPG